MATLRLRTSSTGLADARVGQRVRVISYGLGSTLHEVGRIGQVEKLNRTRVAVRLDQPWTDDRQVITLDPHSLMLISNPAEEV